MGKAHTAYFNYQESSRSKDFNLSYGIPYFLDREVDFSFQIFDSEYNYTESNSFSHTYGYNLDFRYKLTEYLSQALSYSFKTNKLSITKSNTTSKYILDSIGEFNESIIGQRLYYDKRDNITNPSNGYYLKYLTDFAGIGGDVRYIKNEAGAVQYFPFLDKKLIFKILFKTGAIEAYNNQKIKLSHRFFLGGSSLRGFQNAGIGPRDSQGVSLGGNFFYKGTAEFTFPLGLPEELGFKGSLFSDFGSVSHLDSTNTENINDEPALRVSGGIGVFWSSPLGPIRFDYSKIIKKEVYDKTERFRISFGTRF